MGFFSFVQEIAMDLGTANTIIISDDKIVVDEPSVVALDRRTDKMIAVGNEAKMMYEKTHENIRTIRPLRDGVIADFSACEQMMRGLIKMVHTGSRLFSPSLRMVIGVPSGSTEVELRAVRDSAEHADGRDVYLIFETVCNLLIAYRHLHRQGRDAVRSVYDEVLRCILAEVGKCRTYGNLDTLGHTLADLDVMLAIHILK